MIGTAGTEASFNDNNARGFVEPPPVHASETEKCAASKSFTIFLDPHGSCTGQDNERVLVALERAQGFGLLKNMPRRLPVGCRRGGCGVCRMRVLAGEYRKAPMSRAHVSAEDEAKGLILACCIYPLSDLRLRLENPELPNGISQSANT